MPTNWQPALADPTGSGTGEPLPITLGKADATVAALRELPWLGQIAPAPQTLHWDRVATYRVRLTLSTSLCSVAVCYTGVLLDAL